MSKGNVNGAIKLLSDNMVDGIVPLDDETLEILRQKHPEPKQAEYEVLLPDEPFEIHPVIFDEIDADTIRQAAVRTKGGSGPSGMDGDGWRRLLTSKQYGQESTDLCKAIARLAKTLCTDVHPEDALQALLACRLIPLNKNPGIRPIGVGEVLRRIIGKSIATVVKEDVLESVGSLQVCTGQESGSEAAVHAIRQVFSNEDAEAVLLIDATNAFNSVNRMAFIHNAKVICPSLSTFITNCYQYHSRLFIIGGAEIKSTEGTTQGDPIAMFIYAIAIIPLIFRSIEKVQSRSVDAKIAAFADDLAGVGKLIGLKVLWDEICRIGPKYGYFPEPSKSWLIVKPKHLNRARNIFSDSSINITTDGRKHLGAVVGSKLYREDFMSEKVSEWAKEIHKLSEIAKFPPHEAYACFVNGYKHKITYFMRTIDGINKFLDQLDEVITRNLIPNLTGGIQPNELERQLFSLPPSMGGLGIPIFAEQATIEFENSIKMTQSLSNNIINQERTYNIDRNEQSKIKNRIKAARKAKNADTSKRLLEIMTKDQQRLHEINSSKGASVWLSTLPIKEEGFQLEKNVFWDLIQICLLYTSDAADE